MKKIDLQIAGAIIGFLFGWWGSGKMFEGGYNHIYYFFHPAYAAQHPHP